MVVWEMVVARERKSLKVDKQVFSMWSCPVDSPGWSVCELPPSATTHPPLGSGGVWCHFLAALVASPSIKVLVCSKTQQSCTVSDLVLGPLGCESGWLLSALSITTLLPTWTGRIKF